MTALFFGLAVAAVAAVMMGVLAPLAGNLIPSAGKENDRRSQASCANNLKQMGIVYKMFANESEGEVYPALSDTPGKLMFTSYRSPGSNVVYPEYLTDLNVLVCPSDPNGFPSIDDQSYFYLGYVVTNDTEMAAFAKAYEKNLIEGNLFLDDLPVSEGTGTNGTNAIIRFREGIGRFNITDTGNPGATTATPSTIPTMIERPDNHIPAGGNVIYMDGHVEFIPYPGKWPMTEKTIGILESLGGP